MPNFWDQMSPFYDRLPGVKTFGVDVDAPTIGLGVVGRTASPRSSVGSVVAQARPKRR